MGMGMEVEVGSLLDIIKPYNSLIIHLAFL